MTIALSAEAWAAIAAIAAPLVAALVANIKLTTAVGALGKQMREMQQTLGRLPGFETRLAKLEKKPPMRKARAR